MQPFAHKASPVALPFPLALLASIALASCRGASVTDARPAPSTPAACPSASASTVPLLAGPMDFDSLAPTMLAANAKPGVRRVPARVLPVPTDEVSPVVQEFIASGFNPGLEHHPKDAAEWKAIIAKGGATAEKEVRDMAAKLHVTIKPTTVAGVSCFELTPEVVPARNRNRLLVHVHGGAYV